LVAAIVQPPITPARRDLTWLAAVIGALAVVLIVNPVGFVGGGWDDWQYLNAARCWAEQGPCLPRDHWQGRWPIIAPLAAAISVAGESRLTVGLPSLLYSLGCLVLVAWLGNRLAGRPVGYIAALLLLVAPAFAVELVDPTVEAAELFFLLAAACCAARFTETRAPWIAFSAGLCLSLAFQVRETAAAAAPLALLGAWLLARDDRRSWLAALAGALVPLAAELLVYWLATGDPLWRRSLSVAHTQIASSELRTAIDRSEAPFFNPDYIAGWRHAPGLRVHWLVDGLLNLIVNTKAGVTMAASGLLFALYRRSLDPRRRRLVAWALAIAFYWACFLIYVLAIDPKPRMMMVPIALTALALAVVLSDRMAARPAMPAWAVLSVAVTVGMAVTVTHPQVRTSEAAVERWVARYPGQIETNETARRHLALVASARDLASLGSGRPLLLLRLSTRCSVWADKTMKRALVAVGRAPMSLIDPPGTERINNFCLFRYARTTRPEAIRQAAEDGL
jgi:hypothetical protein